MTQPTTPQPQVTWQAPPPEAGPAPGYEFGGFGARLVAYIIDGIILAVVVGGLVTVATLAIVGTDVGIDVVNGDVTVEGADLSPGAWAAFGIIVAIASVVGILYFPWFWARGGRTPGMRPFGLVVVRDVDGGPIGWGAALLRLVGWWVSSAVFYLGFIWIFIDKRRRGWHDLIAGTVVIRRV
jgi:uncharacterized RDD family membrane protein YckC